MRASWTIPQLAVIGVPRQTAACSSISSSARGAGLPIWVAFTLEDSKRAVLRSGEALAGAASWAASEPAVSAILLNCCAPQAISAALPQVQAAKEASQRAQSVCTLMTGSWTAALQALVATWMQPHVRTALVHP